jgi:hypothetical protein
MKENFIQGEAPFETRATVLDEWRLESLFALATMAESVLDKTNREPLELLCKRFGLRKELEEFDRDCRMQIEFVRSLVPGDLVIRLPRV